MLVVHADCSFSSYAACCMWPGDAGQFDGVRVCWCAASSSDGQYYGGFVRRLLGYACLFCSLRLIIRLRSVFLIRRAAFGGISCHPHLGQTGQQ